MWAVFVCVWHFNQQKLKKQTIKIHFVACAGNITIASGDRFCFNLSWMFQVFDHIILFLILNIHVHVLVIKCKKKNIIERERRKTLFDFICYFSSVTVNISIKCQLEDCVSNNRIVCLLSAVPLRTVQGSDYCVPNGMEASSSSRKC